MRRNAQGKSRQDTRGKAQASGQGATVGGRPRQPKRRSGASKSAQEKRVSGLPSKNYAREPTRGDLLPCVRAKALTALGVDEPHLSPNANLRPSLWFNNSAPSDIYERPSRYLRSRPQLWRPMWSRIDSGFGKTYRDAINATELQPVGSTEIQKRQPRPPSRRGCRQ